MRHLSLRRAVAVAVTMLFVAACEDEFAVDPPDGFRAEVETDSWPAHALLGNALTLRVTVTDSVTGENVAPQDIDWTVSPQASAEITSESEDLLVLRPLRIGTITVTATLDDPAFAPASVTDSFVVQLGGVAVGAHPDTLRSLGEVATLHAFGLDGDGNQVQVTGFSWQVQGDAIAPVGALGLDSVRVIATANGSGTVLLSHPLCAGQCTIEIPIGVQQAAAAIALNADSLRLDALGASGSLGVTVTDARGQVITGASGVTWESSAPALVTVTPSSTNALQATVTAAANGASIVRARLGSLVDEATIRVAQRATQVVAIGGDGQTGVVAALLGDSLRLEARDAMGFAVAGTPIGWMVLSGNGSVTGSALTGDDGRAAAIWTLGSTVGGQSAAGFIAGVDTAVFSANAQAGAVASVDAEPDTTTLSAIGASTALTATVRDAYGNARAETITWTALSPSVASVSSSGTVTAVANGTALVEARVGGVADTVVVHVQQTAASITLSIDSLRLASLGAAALVTATVRDAGGSVMVDPSGISWEATSSSVVSIAAMANDSTQATVTAIGNGATFIRARLNGFSDQAPVTVQQVVTSAVAVDGLGQSALVGTLLPDSLVVEARDALGVPVAGVAVTWAVLSGGGAVSGSSITDASGRAAVAWTLGGTLGVQQVRATIAGVDPIVFDATALAGTPTSLEVSPSSALLTHLDDSAQLSAIVRDNAGNVLPAPVTWSTLDEAVATVSPTGLVIAVGNGIAQVVARAAHLADTVDVTVQQLVATITLSPASDTLSVGDTLRFVATARDSGGALVVGAPMTWTSTDGAVASVDGSGKVTANARGAASIRATSSGIIATASVSVVSWALSFDGGDFADVANAPAIEPDPDSTFSIEVWVRPDSTNGGAVLGIWSAIRQTSSWAIRLNGLVPQVLLREPTGNAFRTITAPAPISEDAWHHLAFVYDRGRVRIYVDGALVTSDSVAFLPNNPDATSALRLGADATASGGGNFLSGDIDEIRIWSSARTADEIAANMSTRVTGQPGLRVYWPLYLGAGNPVDIVGGLIAVRGGSVGGAAMPSWITDGSPAP